MTLAAALKCFDFILMLVFVKQDGVVHSFTNSQQSCSVLPRAADAAFTNLHVYTVNLTAIVAFSAKSRCVFTAETSVAGVCGDGSFRPVVRQRPELAGDADQEFLQSVEYHVVAVVSGRPVS